MEKNQTNLANPVFYDYIDSVGPVALVKYI